jgi:hypothetical protein
MSWNSTSHFPLRQNVLIPLVQGIVCLLQVPSCSSSIYVSHEAEKASSPLANDLVTQEGSIAPVSATPQNPHCTLAALIQPHEGEMQCSPAPLRADWKCEAHTALEQQAWIVVFSFISQADILKAHLHVCCLESHLVS